MANSFGYCDKCGEMYLEQDDDDDCVCSQCQNVLGDV